MRKRKPLALVSCVLALALTAGLAGCSIQFSTVTTETEAPALYDASALGDGRLRMFYDYDTGASTVLCGGTVRYQAGENETVSLVTDSLTGYSAHYLVTQPDRDNKESGRRSILYDQDGTEVYTWAQEVSVTQTDNLLVSTAAASFSESYDISNAGSVEVLDLVTLQQLPVPENAIDCQVVGDLLVFTLYRQPENVAFPGLDESYYSHCAVEVWDRAGNVLHTEENCGAYNALCGNWVYLYSYTDEVYDTMLYNVATGEKRGELYGYCTDTTAIFRAESGRYQLYDFSGDSPVLIGEFDAVPDYYLSSGLVLLWQRDEEGYALYDLATGQTTPLRDARVSDDILVAWLTDGTLRLYDCHTGELLSENTVEDADNFNACGYFGQYAWLEQTDPTDQTKVLAVRIYGPDGLVGEIADLPEKYVDFSGLTVTEDGPLFTVSYPVAGRYIRDVLDVNGNVLLEGLASCWTAYPTANYPQGCFRARRGFYCGLMNADGEWLYCESIFSTLSAEDGVNYY